MKKTIFPLIFLSILIMSVSAYSLDVRRDLECSLVRLHIIAQSDSERDQAVKLAVRDAVLAAADGISAVNAEEFKKAAEAAANEYLEQHNIDYRARAEYGLFEFPQKEYMNITLPAGRYNGIRIILGSGSGHNWWCVMYPPLCTAGSAAYADTHTCAALKSRLRTDTYGLISSSKPEIRFKILELLHR